MIYKLQDIININHLKNILIKINDTFPFAVAIIDNNKEIISTYKWQKFCLELNQKNKEYLKEFEISIEQIIEIIDYKVPPTLINKCFQGISYIAIPLFIMKKYYGYILAGQFFLKEPDLEIYKNLAKKFGFEEASYLKKISKIPIITKKEIENHLSFIHEYIKMSITNYKLIQSHENHSDIDNMASEEIKDALMASEGRFKKLVESIIDYIYTVRIEKGKVISTSHGPGCVTVTGYTSEEYEEDQYLWYRMVFEEDRDAVIEQASQMISGKQALPLEHRIIHKNGSIKWVRNTPVLHYNEKHAIIGYDGLIVDITERKRLEEILEKDKEELKQIIDSSPIIIFYKDIEGKVIRVNKTFAEALKIPEESLIGKTVFDLYSTEIAQVMTDDDNEVLRTKKAKLNIIEKYQSTAGLRWVRTDKMPIFDKKGNPIGLIGFAQDITEQKKAEESLRISAEQYHLITTISMDGFVVVNLKGELVDVNEIYCQMIGYSKDELLTMSVPDLEAIDSLSEINERIKNVIDFGLNRFESKHKCRDGHIIDVEISMTFFSQSDHILVFLRDITEHKKAEELLIIKENTIASSISGIALADFNGNVTYVNPAFIKLWGYENENEVIGKPAFTYALSEKKVKGIIKTLLKDNLYIGELIAKKKDGSFFNVLISANVVKDKIGNPICMMGSFLDITKSKQAEEALCDSEERFRAAFENANVGVCLVNTDGYIFKANNMMSQIFGYNKEELEKMTVNDIAYNDDRKLSPTFIKDAISGKIKQDSFDKRYIHKDGHIVWGHVSSSIVRDSWGKPMYFISHIQDITERKKTEEELQYSKEYAEKLIHTANAMIVCLDNKGRITVFNESAEKITGYKMEELKDKNWFETIVPKDRFPQVWEVFNKFSSGELPKYFENPILTKSGEERYISWQNNELIEKCEIAGTISFGIDITEKKKAEQSLIKFNEELEKRVQQRTEELINVNKELESFSYTVSHDLRAPLRSINGFSQILLEDYKDKLDTEAIGYINRIINSSNKLAELIDHILNLSRITRSEIHKVKVDLSKMANDIIIELTELNPERKINFICEKGMVVNADYTLIHSALYNIIQNAWKYTSKKSKTKIEFGETKKLDNRVFYIKDNGVGFDMKYSDKLFKVFQRLHSDKEFEGSGIGLATVHHIINKHGGSTWAESEVNKGTTIYFTLE